jgi:hypothetical protein
MGIDFIIIYTLINSLATFIFSKIWQAQYYSLLESRGMKSNLFIPTLCIWHKARGDMNE